MKYQTAINQDQWNITFSLVTALLFALFMLCYAGNSQAAGLPAYRLTVKDGHFIPETVEVKAGERFKIVVHNAGPGPEEFESKELRKESVLAEGVTRSVVFAPLKPGTYSFFGEFHPETAKGQIVAR